MKKLYALWLILALPIGLLGQTPNVNIGFEKIKDTLIQCPKKDIHYRLNLKAVDPNIDSLLKLRVYVVPDIPNSTLAAPEYQIDFKSTTIGEILEAQLYSFYVTVKSDSQPDKDRLLILKIILKDSTGKDVSAWNTSESKLNSLVVRSSEIDTALKSYNYLAYLGTNFDLVDRIKPREVFFASNVFLPPERRMGTGFHFKNSMGVYLSIYGNRAMSLTDTSTNAVRDYQITPYDDTSAIVYREQGNLTRTRVSDNMGALISPLWKLNNRTEKASKLQLFLAPTFEFVWRRTTTTSMFENGIPIDTVVRSIKVDYPIQIPATFTSSQSEFLFRAGILGLMLVHETNAISFRVQGCVGLVGQYTPIQTISSPAGEVTYETKGDIFFAGRAWLTESKTGITLQAEITNTLKIKRPIYVVTLSKSFNFQQIGTLFTPLTK